MLNYSLRDEQERAQRERDREQHEAEQIRIELAATKSSHGPEVTLTREERARLEKAVGHKIDWGSSESGR